MFRSTARGPAARVFTISRQPVMRFGYLPPDGRERFPYGPTKDADPYQQVP